VFKCHNNNWEGNLLKVLGYDLLISKARYFVGYTVCIQNKVVSILGHFGPLSENCKYRK